MNDPTELMIHRREESQQIQDRAHEKIEIAVALGNEMSEKQLDDLRQFAEGHGSLDDRLMYIIGALDGIQRQLQRIEATLGSIEAVAH